MPGPILLSLRGPMSDIPLVFYNGLMTALSLMLVMTLLVAVVRREWIAAAIFWAGSILLYFTAFEHPAIDIWFAAVDAAIIVFCVIRLGLLATITFFIVNSLIVYAPFTSDLSAWYATHALPYYAIIAFLLVYGYRTSTAGKNLFSGDLMPDLK